MKKLVTFKIEEKEIKQLDFIWKQGWYPSRTAFILRAIDDLIKKEQIENIQTIPPFKIKRVKDK